MIRLIKFVLFLFYRYYKVGPKADNAYLSSVLSFLALVFLNMVTVLGILNIGVHNILPYEATDEKWLQYIKVTLVISLPGYFIVSLFFKKETIKSLEYNEAKIEVGKVLLPIYVVASIIAAIALGKP